MVEVSGNCTQAHQAENEWIIPILVDRSQTAKSEQQMNDRQQNNQMPAKNRGYFQMGEAFSQSVLEVDSAKKNLEDQ